MTTTASTPPEMAVPYLSIHTDPQGSRVRLRVDGATTMDVEPGLELGQLTSLMIGRTVVPDRPGARWREVEVYLTDDALERLEGLLAGARRARRAAFNRIGSPLTVVADA